MTIAWSAAIAALSWATSAIWSVTCCMGDRVLLGELLKAGEVALRLAQQRLILGQLPLRLGQRRLIGARIDLGDEVARLHRLAFGEADVLQRSGDLGAYGHGLERRHRSQGVDGEGHIAGYDRRHAHGLGRLRRSAGGLLSVGGRSGVLVLLPRVDRRGGEGRNDHDP